MKKMKTKFVGILAIAGLIAMAVFVGTATADGGADIYGSRFYGYFEQQHNFTTADNLYAWGDFGDYSYTYTNPPCPDGCGGRIYVVEHKETWTNGDLLDDVSGGFETLPWSNSFFEMAWLTPLEPGTYDLILDLNVSGTENYYVWTNISDPYGGYITDYVWSFTVIGPLPPETEEVYIDIKPESCPNPIYLGKQGLQSVAVLGTADFDVTDIDPETILLTREGYEDVGVAPIRWSYEDVAMPYEGELCGCHEEGADGYADLTLKFKTQDLVSTLNLAEVVGETIPLTLTGELKDGTSFEGKDCIWVLETNKK
ncbi:hypothetical protein C5S35_10200 [Candidatus Methanophagaceae archaeon]|nr:hypothetical protein C5S35_10200 [Methanophagales archaeon]